MGRRFRGRLAVLALAGVLGAQGCGDANAPLLVAGRYNFVSFNPTVDWTPFVPYEYPFAPLFVLDSVKNTVVLSADGTYQESGALWGHGSGFVGVSQVPIESHGTYTLNGSAITFVADVASLMPGGTGTVLRGDGTLTFTRGYTIWNFKR